MKICFVFLFCFRQGANVADSDSGSRFIEIRVIEGQDSTLKFFMVFKKFILWLGDKWVKIFACAALERAVCCCAFELHDSKKQSLFLLV